jgi:hypothetical protein
MGRKWEKEKLGNEGGKIRLRLRCEQGMCEKTDKRKGRKGKCSPYHISDIILVKKFARLSHVLDSA